MTCWWQWPTVLSLDAPAVCVVWHALLAHVAGTRPGWPQGIVLGASVWLAYVADRWIEAWRLDPIDIRTERHHFYQLRRWPVALVWLLVFVADLVVATTTLTTRELLAGTVLLVLVLVYLLSHQLVHRHRRWRLPKELCIALLLTGGVCVFLITTPQVDALTASAALFGLLCFANCALISHWEHDVDVAHQQSSLAVDSDNPPWLIPLLPWTVAGVALASFAVSVDPQRIVAACTLASAVLLGIVDRLERQTGRRVARVLSDVALLTPVVPLVYLL